MTTREANKNWYYVDVCYDDVKPRVHGPDPRENAGDMRHVNFLVSPSGLEGRYSKYYDYIDSLYDGYTYTKNSTPDMKDGQVVLNNGKPHYFTPRRKTRTRPVTPIPATRIPGSPLSAAPSTSTIITSIYVDTTTNQNLLQQHAPPAGENGNNGSSGSGSSGNNSQMQQFMKKMQSRAPILWKHVRVMRTTISAKRIPAAPAASTSA